MAEIGQTTVLLVENAEGVQSWLQSHLEVDGFRVLVATDAAAALDLVQQEHPQLVVLDLLVDPVRCAGRPARSTVRTCRLVLRQLRDVCQVPVMVFSTQRHAATRIEWLALGADAYVVWPCDRGRLMAQIRALSNGGRRAASDPLQGEPHGARAAVRSKQAA